MSSSSYSSKLRDARWQRKRLEIMQRDEFTCKSCGASDKDEGTTLNVHHAYYEYGKNPWEYPSSSLVTWCEKCHEKRKVMARYIDESVIRLSMEAYSGLMNMVVTRDDTLLFKAMNHSAAHNVDINSLAMCAKALITQMQTTAYEVVDKLGGDL